MHFGKHSRCWKTRAFVNEYIAFYERDPVDLAIEWANDPTEPVDPVAIPVIMPANDKRPGGDWEAGVMSPEECLCRRSNLFATITTPAPGNSAPTNYPIPSKAGIFSRNVGMFFQSCVTNLG